MSDDRADMLLRRQKVLADFGDFALQSEDLDEILTVACRLVAAAMEIERAKVLEIEGDGERLLLRAGVGWAPDIVGGTQIPMSERSSESYSISERRPVISRDISREPRFDIPDFMKREGVRALVNVPIFLPGGRAFGLLQVDATTPRDFDQDDVAFLRTYATLLGPIIDRILKLSALKTSEERFRMTVEEVSDYAIYITDKSDRITDWLPGAIKLFGWSAQEAIGQQGSILFTQKDRDGSVDAEELAQARERGFAPNRRWHLRKDGSRIFIEGSVRALRDAQGRLCGYIKIGQDVTQKREGDVRLRESERRLEVLFTSAPVGLSEVALDGRFLRTNSELCRILGRSPEEVLAASVVDVTHPDDVPASREAMARALSTGQSASLDKRYLRPDGEVLWANSALTVLPGHDGRPGSLLAVTTDLTARRAVEQAQRISDERLRSVLNAMAEGFAHLGPDFTILDINEETLQLDGRHRDDLIGQKHWDAFPHTRDSPIGDLLRTVMRDRVPGAMEHRYTWSHGQTIWLDMRVYPTPDGGVATFWRDISDRKRAEAALLESEQRFRRFGEASRDIIWIRDAETLQWQYLTPAFEQIYGISRDDAEATNTYEGWLDLVVPEDRARVAENIRRVQNGEHVAFEYRIRRPVDGATRSLRSTDFPILDEDGKVVLIGGIGHDLTELRETQSRLEALVEGIPQLVWRAKEPGQWTWASPQWTSFTGQSNHDSHGWGWLGPLHPGDWSVARQAWEQAVEQQEFRAEYRICDHASGVYRWFQTRAAPLRDEAGEILEWLGTSTDIHDLRELQARQAVLVAELQHRTRNLITVVGAVSRQTLRNVATLDEFDDRFSDRLEALSRVQGLLSHLSAGQRVTFESLLSSELAALGAPDDKVTLEGHAGVPLPSASVQIFSLALHELATNALKYGAFASPGGHLTVRWSLSSSETRGSRLQVDWRETGVVTAGQGTPEAGSGYGRELIEHALPYQLDAETTYRITPTGVHCTIDVPVLIHQP